MAAHIRKEAPMTEADSRTLSARILRPPTLAGALAALVLALAGPASVLPGLTTGLREVFTKLGIGSRTELVRGGLPHGEPG
jgi:hypothetical protein